MKNFKFFSRILCIFVLVFVFSFNCFATSISDFAPINEVINNDFSNENIVDRSASASLLSLPARNYDYDPNNLPWDEMPQYIQDIVYMAWIDPVSIPVDDAYIKNPFVAVLCTNTFIRVVVGINLSLGRYYTTVNGVIQQSSMYLFGFPKLGSFKDTVCYSADYYPDYTIKVDWHSVESSAYGSNGNIVRYPGLGVATNARFDLYGYGGNYSRNGTLNLTFPTGTSDPSVAVVQNNNGFASGRFVGYQNEFINAYFSFFTPKTLGQIEAETQKGIWESIKSIPDLIADKLKGLFIPDEGFFNEYFNNLQTFFSNKLGFLVYPFDFIITFLQKYLDIGEGDGILHLPDFDIMDVKIFNQVDFNLKDSMSSFLGEYYNIYFAFVDFIILIGLVNLALKKFNSMSGGNSE